MMNLLSSFNNYQHLTLIVVALCSGALLQATVPTEASPTDDRQQAPFTFVMIEKPAETVLLLDSLIKSILYSQMAPQDLGLMTQKRGLDLGINRGFSGSQTGKHLMGLSAASIADGPGK